MQSLRARSQSCPRAPRGTERWRGFGRGGGSPVCLSERSNTGLGAGDRCTRNTSFCVSEAAGRVGGREGRGSRGLLGVTVPCPLPPLHCCCVGSNPPLTTSVKTQVGTQPTAHRYTKGCISYALDKGPTLPRWLLPGSHREGGPGVPAPISQRDFANVRANAAGLGLTRAARGEGLRKQHPRSLYKERTSWEVAQLCKQEPGETGHGGTVRGGVRGADGRG